MSRVNAGVLDQLRRARQPVSGEGRRDSLGLPPPPDLYAAWWTGSLLASGGRTQGAGHTYVFGTTTYSDDYGSFDDAWHYASRASSHVVAFGVGALAGITDRLDLGISLASYYKRSGGHDSAQFGDLGVKLAFQVLRSINGSWIPDILVYVKETFPTGRYERLDPTLGGVDAGGAGTYATTVGLNLQKLLLMPNRHLLKLRANFAYQYSTKVDLHGISTYGGSPTTEGYVEPGSNYLLLLAGEYQLSRRWAVALDVQWSHNGADRFFGVPGRASDGSLASVGGATANTIAIAPGIELNVTGELGIILGLVWTPLAQNALTAFGPSIAIGFGI